MTREEAKITLETLLSSAEDEDGPELIWTDKEAIAVAIEALEQPEEKKGKWIVKTEGPYLEKIGYCSRCGYDTGFYPFYECCPHCGAKMEAEQ